MMIDSHNQTDIDSAWTRRFLQHFP